jgi:hypothetical protein
MAAFVLTIHHPVFKKPKPFEVAYFTWNSIEIVANIV